jgi:hypothetical protein
VLKALRTRRDVSRQTCVAVRRLVKEGEREKNALVFEIIKGGRAKLVRAAIKALPLPLEDLREFQQQESLARREGSKQLRIGNRGTWFVEKEEGEREGAKWSPVTSQPACEFQCHLRAKLGLETEMRQDLIW